MFYDQSESGTIALQSPSVAQRGVGDVVDGVFLAPSGSPLPQEGLDPAPLADAFDGEEEAGFSRGVYERELIQSVWEFGEIVPGTDPALWRRDEFGDWIHRFDYGRRGSAFGWEIFDPGVGRHSQGVYAMRPMQWESYIRQYEAFA